MPDTWKELPLQESPKLSLAIAVRHLPFFLSKSTAVDDEVAQFTQNGGWRKLDKLRCLIDWMPSPTRYCEGWIASLRQFTTNVKVRDLPLFEGSD